MSEEKAISTERASTPIVGHGFEPQNAQQLMEMAKFVAGAALVPEALRNKPADCFLIMAMGMEYGFGAMQSLQTLHIVKGRVGLPGEACAALIQSHPQCKDFRIWLEGEGEQRTACVQSWRKGREKANEVVKFSRADAKRAGLSGENWNKYPDDMLTWKAVARDKRRNWPDVYSKLQVIEDLEDEPRVVRNVTPPAERKPLEQDPAVAAIKALSAPRESVTLEVWTEDEEPEAATTPPSKVDADTTPAPTAASGSDHGLIVEPAPEAPEELRKAIWTRATQTSNAHAAAPKIEAMIREKFGADLSGLSPDIWKRAATMALNCRVDPRTFSASPAGK